MKRKNAPRENTDQRPAALWLASWYPTPHHPFFGNFIQRQAEAAAAFCDITVLYIYASGQSSIQEVHHRRPGLTEVVFSFPERRFMISWATQLYKFFRYLLTMLQAWRYVVRRRGRPDLLHLHVIYPAGLPALLLHWWTGLPLLVSEHWTGYRPESRQRWPVGLRWLVGLISRAAAAVIAISGSMAEAMRRKGLEGNYTIIPNVVDLPEHLPEKLAKAKDTFRFLHVSLLSDVHKNISGLLRAVEKLARSSRDFHLTIIGDGPDKPALEALSTTLGIREQVNFEGALPHDLVLQQLQQADAFVMFSNYEGLPCVLLEALAAGLPVIATETGGIGEWVDEETGILLKPQDEEGLTEALSEMMDQAHTYDPVRVRSRVQARCSYPAVGHRLFEVYEKIRSR